MLALKLSVKSEQIYPHDQFHQLKRK